MPSGIMGRPIPWEAILKQSSKQPIKAQDENAASKRRVSQKVATSAQPYSSKEANFQQPNTLPTSTQNKLEQN